jgi:hypothetical protein
LLVIVSLIDDERDKSRYLDDSLGFIPRMNDVGFHHRFSVMKALELPCLWMGKLLLSGTQDKTVKE